MNNALKRYNRNVLVNMSLYCLMLFGSILYLKHYGQSLHWSLKSLIAIAPVVPIVFFCKAFVVFINESDEMMRRIELEAISLSSLVVGLLYMCLGFLGRNEIIALDGVTVAVWVFPLLCGFYGITKWFAAKRYQ